MRVALPPSMPLRLLPKTKIYFSLRFLMLLGVMGCWFLAIEIRKMIIFATTIIEST